MSLKGIVRQILQLELKEHFGGGRPTDTLCTQLFEWIIHMPSVLDFLRVNLCSF